MQLESVGIEAQTVAARTLQTCGLLAAVLQSSIFLFSLCSRPEQPSFPRPGYILLRLGMLRSFLHKTGELLGALNATRKCVLPLLGQTLACRALPRPSSGPRTWERHMATALAIAFFGVIEGTKPGKTLQQLCKSPWTAAGVRRCGMWGAPHGWEPVVVPAPASPRRSRR